MSCIARCLTLAWRCSLNRARKWSSSSSAIPTCSFFSGSQMPDFHASEGFSKGGRSVCAQPFDGRRLGPWIKKTAAPAGYHQPGRNGHCRRCRSQSSAQCPALPGLSPVYRQALAAPCPRPDQPWAGHALGKWQCTGGATAQERDGSQGPAADRDAGAWAASRG